MPGAPTGYGFSTEEDEGKKADRITGPLCLLSC